MFFRQPLCACLLAALALVATPSLAQQPTGFTLGVGVGIGNDPYIGDDTEISPVPLIRYQGENFSVGFDGITYQVLQRDAFTLSGIAAPRIFGLVFADADELDGIDRDITVDLGISARYDSGFLFGGAKFLQEVTGEHDGQELTLELGTRIPLGPVPLSLSAGVDYQTESLSRYLWGVRGSEAIAGRDAYSPDGVLIPFVSASAFYPVSSNVSLTLGARAQFLPDEVTDSPIVDEDQVYTGFLGIGYRF
ncbi:MAG: MipA/OmpV family protein [Pseudomonadota bacterium]